MNTFWAHLAKDAPEYTALLGLLVVAAVANMPVPGSKPSWGLIYRWLYDTLQAFLAARSPHPTLPAQPAPEDQPQTQVQHQSKS